MKLTEEQYKALYPNGTKWKTLISDSSGVQVSMTTKPDSARQVACVDPRDILRVYSEKLNRVRTISVPRKFTKVWGYMVERSRQILEVE